MGLLTLIRVALKALGRNKLRTSLAMLGIAIGIGAVVSMVAVGEGASVKVEGSIASLGANMIWVEAGSANAAGVRTGNASTRSLKQGDADAIATEIPFVTNVSPQVDTGVQIVYGNKNWRSTVRGESPEYLAVKEWAIVQGDMFTDQDVRSAANVVVLGQSVLNNLFINEDPINKMVRVKGVPCKVIGVLAAKGATATGQDQDDTFLMPYTTVMKKIKGGQYWLDDIICSATSTGLLAEAERQIAVLLRERHHIAPGAPDDFNMRHPVEIAEAVAKSVKDMEMLLASIAAISLLVGGVGIMNIMLVSVTERTREIGIRMSVGARQADIQKQFLLEALYISLAGGAIGITIGAGTSYAITNILQWPVHVTPNSLLLAFGFSVSIGVFFGFYPASKAAALDPIHALRHEAG
jgi:putative ABC transport system permease protein